MGKSTKELTNELVRREGIEIIEVLPYEIATIKKDKQPMKLLAQQLS